MFNLSLAYVQLNRQLSLHKNYLYLQFYKIIFNDIRRKFEVLTNAIKIFLFQNQSLRYD